MYTVRLVVEGIWVSLLINGISQATKEAMISGVKKSGTAHATPAQEAEDGCYRLPCLEGQNKGQLCLPTLHFRQAIVAAGSGFNVKGQGKKTYKSVLSGCLMTKPEYTGLTDLNGNPLFDYQINLTPVSVNNAKIIRARAEIKEWRTEFDLLVLANTDKVDLANLQSIVSEAGISCGVGDYRQLHGKFRVVSFEKTEDTISFDKK